MDNLYAQDVLTETLVSTEGAGQFLTFAIGTVTYGIPIEKVLQIIGLQSINKMPDTPEDMMGFIHLRGEVIPVMSLRQKFGMPELEDDSRTCFIIVQSQEEKIGIQVDLLNETIMIDKSQITPPPVQYKNDAGSCIEGIANLEESGIILLIKTSMLLSA